MTMTLSELQALVDASPTYEFSDDMGMPTAYIAANGSDVYSVKLDGSDTVTEVHLLGADGFEVGELTVAQLRTTLTLSAQRGEFEHTPHVPEPRPLSELLKVAEVYGWEVTSVTERGTVSVALWAPFEGDSASRPVARFDVENDAAVGDAVELFEDGISSAPRETTTEELHTIIVGYSDFFHRELWLRTVMPSAADVAKAIIAEVAADMAEGLNGMSWDNVADWQDLHDYVDANMYGHELVARVFDSYTHTEDDDALEISVEWDLLNRAIDIADQWVRLEHNSRHPLASAHDLALAMEAEMKAQHAYDSALIVRTFLGTGADSVNACRIFLDSARRNLTAAHIAYYSTPAPR